VEYEMSLKVLFYVRANHETVKGGDLVQLYSTAEALQRQGVRVDFSSDPAANLAPYDLVHVFNSPRFGECISFLENAQRQGKPVALSTIFWSKDELGVGIASSTKVRLSKRYLGTKASIKLWGALKSVTSQRQGSNFRLERRLFSEADLLLPNSEGEMREIRRVYKLGARPYQPVRNAIDTRLFSQQPSLQRESFVLSVGRIESRKNTLELIEACHEARVHLVLIGGIANNDPYNDRCLAKIKDYGFEYLGAMPPARIVPYYYRAKVHAMASWYETPGLASMEAACGGCTLVSTDRGSTKEYFDDHAFYCDPFSRTSIITALTRAVTAPPSLQLRDTIMSTYTWDLAATDTLKGYQEITA
jgi:glycosyltransferase involved in cell wall biosynthesis